MVDNIKELVYSRDTIEFVTVCVEYCAYLENLHEIDSNEVTDRMAKLLPLLYLKASLVPRTEITEEGEYLETSVGEDDYTYLLSRLGTIFASNDAYLEVFLDDMKYSDTPIAASISEDLTDIYQDIRNFITIYERGVTENMNDALYACIENFKTYWGQKLVNVLRALHMLKYPTAENGGSCLGENIDDNTDDLW